MKMSGTAGNLISLDFELVTYRKGCLHAYVNLENGYLTWRDSNQWCNNFTRTLSEEQIRTFRQFADACSLVDQMTVSTTARETPDCRLDDAASDHDRSHRSWLISAQIGDQVYEMSGSSTLPACGESLRSLIEKLCRVSFLV